MVSVMWPMMCSQCSQCISEWESECRVVQYKLVSE